MTRFSVWLMALDRSRDIDLAIEDAEGTDFSFNDWRKKYMKFMKHKKSRVMDQMRKMDRNGTGYITNDDFIHHMVNSGFKTTEKEMRKVRTIIKRFITKIIGLLYAGINRYF